MTYPLFDPKLSADALEKQLLGRGSTSACSRRRRRPPVRTAVRVLRGPPRPTDARDHHVFARTIKDLVCRYHTMLGQGVTRIAGWTRTAFRRDRSRAHARHLGQKQIEAYGSRNSTGCAAKNVFKYKADWEALSERIAYWLDYEHPYITYTNDYIETVWWLLKRLYDKALLYRPQGAAVLPALRYGPVVA